MPFEYFWDGKGDTYYSGYSLSIMKLVGLIGGTILGFTFVMHLFIYLHTKGRNLKAYKTVEQQSTDVKDEVDNSQLNQPNDIRIVRLEIVSDIIFWYAIGTIQLIFSLASGFDHLSTLGACLLGVFLYLFAILYQIFRWSLYDQENKSTLKKFFYAALYWKWWVIVATPILLCLAILVPLLFQRSCICVNTIGYGTLLEKFKFSTQYTRGHYLPELICQPTSICHIYATLPSNTSNSVFINIHTGLQLQNLSAIFQRSPKSKNLTFSCQQIPFPSSIETRGQRNVFTCAITLLQPQTLYTVIVFNDQKAIYRTRYRTLPQYNSKISKTFKIIFGGDFGYYQYGINLLTEFVTYDPDVVLIGGDVAYDNGILHCYYSWDLMLSAFEKSFSTMNRLVPMILAVGNHDIGFNTMSYANITVSDQQGPLFFTYFPQEFKYQANQTGVQDVRNRKTFVHHFLGNFILLTLDSGYLYDFGDPQTSWIEQKLSNLTFSYIPIVQYHNPMFPSCYVEDQFNSMLALNQSREVWLPIFEKHKVIGAFENHVHQFKRTHPIKNGLPNNKTKEGPVFFGDGCIGVGGATCSAEHLTNNSFFKGFFANVQIGEVNHFWLLSLHPSRIFIYSDKSTTFIAYDAHRGIMNDSFYQVPHKKFDL